MKIEALCKMERQYRYGNEIEKKTPNHYSKEIVS